jgi:hypothetical protein
MPTTIKLTNGNTLTTIPDTQLVTTYAGLSLIGKKYPSYCTVSNTDLVHITENFAASTAPTNPLIGQFWYDTNEKVVKYYDGTSFKQVAVLTSDSSEPTDPNESDQWFDTNTEQLYIYYDYAWVLIGPALSATSSEGWITETYSAVSANIDYEELFVNGNAVCIGSSNEIVPTSTPIIGFSNIRSGLNFVSSEVEGTVSGGIYNATDVTLGEGDEFSLSTDDSRNGLVTSNGNLTQINAGGQSENIAAFTSWKNGELTGNIYLNNEMVSNITISNDLISVGKNIFSGNLAVTGNIWVGPNSNISAPGTSGQVLFNEASNIGATTAISVSGTSTSLNGPSELHGAATLDSTLTVAGAATLNAGETVSGAIQQSGGENHFAFGTYTDPSTGYSYDAKFGGTNKGIAVNGSSLFNSDISIAGSTELHGAATLDSTLNVTGATTLDSTLTVEQGTTLDTTLSVGTTTELHGAATLDSTLSVAGASSLNNTLNVTGATTLDSTLVVEQGTTLDSTLSVSGATTLNSTLAVSGAATLSSSETVGGTLNVVGTTTLNSGVSGSQFSLPTSTLGALGTVIMSMGSGTTQWSTSNIAEWSNYSATTPGYMYLPNGLLIQWAKGTQVSNGSGGGGRGQTTVSWDISFPHACFAVSATVGFVNTVSGTDWQGVAFYVQPGTHLSSVYLQYDTRSDGSASSPFFPIIFGIGY